MSDWQKLGFGVADAEVFTDILARAGKSTTPPPIDWALGQKVAQLDYVPKNKPFLIGDATIPSETQRLLEDSPKASLHARWLLQEIAPCIDPRYVGETVIGGCYGCKTDNIEDFGYVYSSKTCLTGFIEGIVSSLANWKIYALGMKHHEWTDELVTAHPDVMFVSPLRPAEQVPIGTVVHTQYCCMHLLEWYQCVLKSGSAPDGSEYRARTMRERITRGLVEMEEVLPYGTPSGVEFFTNMQAWGNQLLEDQTGV